MEAFVLRDLPSALLICNLVPYLNLDESSTLNHTCNVSAAALAGGKDLEEEFEVLDRLIDARGEEPTERSCSAELLYKTWSTRGFLPTDTVVLGRLLRDCESLDAWVRTELVVGLESVAFQRRGSNRDHLASAISAEQITEALVWALDEEVVYLGGFTPTKVGGFLRSVMGKLKLDDSLRRSLKNGSHIGPTANRYFQIPWLNLLHSLAPASWRFSHSFLAYWEEETWEGPAFIAVPESQLSAEECLNSGVSALKYESLLIRLQRGRR